MSAGRTAQEVLLELCGSAGGVREAGLANGPVASFAIDDCASDSEEAGTDAGSSGKRASQPVGLGGLGG